MQLEGMQGPFLLEKVPELRKTMEFRVEIC